MRITVLVIFAITLTFCNKMPDRPWSEVLPEKTVAVYIPGSQGTIKSIVDSNTGSFFDDITTSALPVMADIEIAAKKLLTYQAVFFYPTESDQMQLVWILTNQTDLLKTLRSHFARPLFVDEYEYREKTIYKLPIDQRILYVLETDSYLYISESSLALEQIILTSTDQQKPLSISSDITSKNEALLINFGRLDELIQQYVAVKYFPYLNQAFKGLGVAKLSVSEGNQENQAFLFSGSIPLENETDALATALSTTNETISLDQYIPTDAASFSIVFSKPVSQTISKPLSALDSALRANPTLSSKLVNALDNELAIVGFAPTGLTGVGENLHIRKIKDTRAVYEWLREMENRGLISSMDNTYYFRSHYLSKIIASGLADYETFYMGITSEGMVISSRLGLTNRVKSDRSRRRVIAFNQTYLDIKTALGNIQSGFIYADSKLFNGYVQNYLNPNANLEAFTSKFEIIAGKFEISTDRSNLLFSLNGYSKKRSTQPFEEQWIAPMDGATITGTPVLADIGGNNKNEVIVANTMRKVLGIANDGTVYFSADTGSDIPIGSPVVYDWYGNGQSAILVAAGNKVYAWNTSGTPLPKFPFTLQEQITAPLLVTDINRDGIPEIIVATADRQIHALDGRGDEMRGWPVSTAAEVRFKPYFGQLNAKWSLFVQSDNGLYSYDAFGRLNDDFPIFISSAFSSEPVSIQKGLMFGATDGHLYRLAADRMFSDTLNVLRNTAYDSVAAGLHLSAIYLSNAAINAAPLVQKLQIKTDSSLVYREDMLITQSANGAIFVTNTLGELRFTTNMGQPSANGNHLILADLQKDGKPELLAVAGFGRLYAWELYRGNRYYDLPTTAIEHPILTDLDGDGYPELIAQTRGGLRCWTLFGKLNEN